jgi:ribosome-binding factor A
MNKRTTNRKGRRGERIANVIRQIVSEELVLRLNDPRLGFVTVTGVDLAADLRVADVRVSVLGDTTQQEKCLGAIRHAHGHIQAKVAAALVTKFVPVLKFHLDQSVKRSVSLSAIIAKARAEDEANRADRIRRGVEPPTPEALASDSLPAEEPSEDTEDQTDEEES